MKMHRASNATHLAAVLSATMVSATAFADTFKWDNNGGDNRLANRENWYLDGSPAEDRTRALPTESDHAEVSSSSAYATLGQDESFTAASMYVGRDSENHPKVEVADGTFTVAGELMLGHWGQRGEMNVLGGNVTLGSLSVGNFGSRFHNKFNVSGTGNVTVLGELKLGTESKDGRGEMTVSGGTVDVQGRASVGNCNLSEVGGADEYKSVLSVSGGKMAAASMEVGNATSAGGLVQVSGTGVLEIEDSLKIGCGGDAWAQVKVAGGELDAGDVFVGVRSGGALFVTGGGAVKANKIQRDQYAPDTGSYTMFVDGGTIVAKKDADLFFASLDAVTLGEDGMVFDTDGYNVTIEACHAFDGIGSFTKKGAGTLTIKYESFGIQCNYNAHGKIVVEAGTLKLPSNQTIYCEGVEVASGATLDYNGSSVYVVEKEPRYSIWTNAAGDGDAANAANWQTVLHYFGQGVDFEETVAGMLPPAGAPVKIPAGAALPSNLDELDVGDVVMFLYEGTACLRGEQCVPPNVVKAANAWYDFDDASTVTLADESSIVSVKNKGAAGADLDAELVGGAANMPLYGDNGVNSRNVMWLTTDGDENTARQGLQSKSALSLSSNQDRAIVVVSRNASQAVPHYPMGIEKADNTNMWSEKGGHFRIQNFEFMNKREFLFQGAKSSSVDDETGETAYNYESLSVDPGQRIGDWTVSLFQANDGTVTAISCNATSGMRSGEATGILDLNASGTEYLYVGHSRINSSGVNHGQVAEALYYDHALTSEEIEEVYGYLKAKWLTKADLTNIPANLELAQGAKIDFGGGAWTFETIKGNGTIGTASVVVTGSVEPGLTVEGTVAFGNDATIDLAPYDNAAVGQRIVMLTADKIENWPAKARSNKRISTLELVENQDGTVSLVGTLASVGYTIRIR